MMLKTYDKLSFLDLLKASKTLLLHFNYGQ